MADTYQIKKQNAPYFLTFQVVEWIDVFTRAVYRDIVLESFTYCIANKGLQLFGYVVMSNHIHLIVQAGEGFQLSNIVRDIKSFTTKRIIKTIQESPESRRDWMLHQFKFAASLHRRNDMFQLWTHENHAIELVDEKVIEQKLNYIHDNPVRARLVKNAEDYLYSSARNYADLDNLIAIERI